jgi:carbonic anhydrase
VSVIDSAVSANATIANHYDVSRGGPPKPKVVIVTCMDPRLSHIGEMLGLPVADMDVIRNAGSVINGDSIRSILISTKLLGSQEVMIINHTDCGMLLFKDDEMKERLRKETGRAAVAPSRFYSFTDVEENTREQMQKARSHPWMVPDVPVRGFIFDVKTGRLHEVFLDGETSAAS